MPATVSIIIPTYNQEAMLENCLRALAAQDFDTGKFEIIVIDDGSTDGTGKLAGRLMQDIKNLKYWRQENGGPASARNKGIEKASGRIIGFTDSDCIPDGAWIKTAMPFFDNDSIAGVEGKTTILNPGDNTPFSHHTENTTGNRFLTCNIFYLKEVLEEAGGFDERFKLAIREDSDLAFTILEKGRKIAFSENTLVAHPAIKHDYTRLFKKAREGFYEALLYNKHPELYKRKLKWLDGRAFPVYYYGYYLALPLLAAYVVSGESLMLIISALAFLLSHSATLAAACRRRTVKLVHVAVLFMQFLIIPYIRFYWVIKGNLKFGNLPGNTEANQ